MKRSVETVTINDLTMEYSIIGEGAPIVVMHGGHSNCLEEFGYQALIEEGYSIITPSRPGYGATSKEIGESLAVACEHYVSLIRHLKLGKVHVIAMSAGGPSGIYFAAAYPEYVKSLTLQSAVTKEWLQPEDKEYRAAKVLFHPRAEKYTWKLISKMNNSFPQFIFKEMFSSFSILNYNEARDKWSEHDIEAVRKMNNRQRSGSGFFIDLAQVNDLTISDLKSVQCPTLIMHSEHDGSVPIDHAHYAKKHIENSELCVLNSWGHLIWLGHSSEYVHRKFMHFLTDYN
jgi:pimeloyl-ACP methyl ester carboxylesterase